MKNIKGFIAGALTMLLVVILVLFALYGCTGDEQTEIDISTSETILEPTSEPPIGYIYIKNDLYSIDSTALDLTEMELTNIDIEPLRQITNLTWLNLNTNQISDISVLSNLNNLSILSLYGNIGKASIITNICMKAN